jgi:hypothetical protein
MSESVERRLTRLEKLVAMQGSRQERRLALTEQRVMSGTASWADYELAMGTGVPAWRNELMRWLPLALVTSAPEPPALHPVMALLVMGHRDLDPDQRATLDQINTGWQARSDDWEHITWAICRLALGTDDGKLLRAQWWRRHAGGSVLAEGVLAVSHSKHLHAHINKLVSYGALSELSATVATPGDPAHAPPFESLARSGCRLLYEAASCLELAILLDPEDEPPWLGEPGRRWILGQNRSDSVTRPARTSTRDLVLQSVQRRMFNFAGLEAAQPTPWRTDRWHAAKATRQAASAKGPSVIRESSFQQEQG